MSFPKKYAVRPGDSWRSIAKRFGYGTDDGVRELAKANGRYLTQNGRVATKTSDPEWIINPGAPPLGSAITLPSTWGITPDERKKSTMTTFIDALIVSEWDATDPEFRGSRDAHIRNPHIRQRALEDLLSVMLPFITMGNSGTEVAKDYIKGQRKKYFSG